PRGLRARALGRGAARGPARGAADLSRPAASRAADRPSRGRGVVRRLQGNERGRHRRRPFGPRQAGGAHRRRRRQGPGFRAARGRRRPFREHGASHRPRRGPHRAAARERGRRARALPVARGGGGARGRACRGGRGRAPFARLRELRHVPQLQASRRGVRGRREGARRMSRTYVFARSAPDAEYDRSLTWAVLILASLGLVMVYSASIAIAEASRFTGNNPAWYLERQSMYIGVAIVAALAVFLVPVRWWQGFAPWLFVLGVALLVLVLVPGIGREVNGARRWLALPGMSLQPSELMKLAAVLYAADYTVRKHTVMKSFRKGLLPMLAVMLLVSWLLLREPDFGALVVIAVTAFGILFLGGMNGRHFAALLGMLGAGFALLVLSSPYRMQRIFGFMDPWSDAFGKGYQLSHALIAFGRGEWLGVGLGASVEKLHYLPEAHTDFLLAVI